MLVKAKDLKAGMKIELVMMASNHARKKKITKTVEIEEDVYYSEGDKEVMVDFMTAKHKKVGSLCFLHFKSISWFK
jgi:hypothetical protein